VGYRRERGILGGRRAAQAPLWEPRPREIWEDFQLDPGQIELFFKRDGPLAQRFNSFSERPEQIAMAREVAQAFNGSRFLIAEAGTGTGKSFAYLVPAVLWAQGRGHDGRVVVSTNTKNLQDQLFSKDIPALKEALGDFQAVLLKGRANYLCLHRWESLLLESAGGLGLETEALLSIPVWLEETETGDITENNGFWKGERAWELAKELNDDPDYCLGRECPFYESCFSIRARRAAREAEIVVVNHALLLADLELDHGILGEYKHLIVDEAHNLEEAASEHLTRRLSFWEVNDLLTELYRVRGARLSGLLPLLRERLGRSGLKAELKEAILGRIEEGIDSVQGLRRQSGEIFARLTEALRERRRIEEEDYPLEHPVKGRYSGRLFAGLEDELEELEVGLALLAGALKGIRESLEGLEEGLLIDQQGLSGRTAADLAWTKRLLDLLEFITAAADEDFVYWFELPAERERFAALYATPLEVAGLLYEGLFRGLEAAVFTSATLAVADDFHYLEERLGLDRLGERVSARSFGDPFDYEKNARLAVPEFLPSPKEEGFHRELAGLLRELSSRIGRRMMVLFTSHKLLRQVYGELREAGEAGEVFAQGLGGSRAQLMEEFRRSPTRRAILLGTSSFWEGVDLPGESLEILVLTKLPFPVPGEPVIEARVERIEAGGGDPFQELFLPQAVLKLRQGFGRLIRAHEDRGAVIITDNRIVHQRYGRLFRRSLPLPLITYYTPSRLLVELEEFFAQQGKL
ncbi:MAG: ATP-dependent DNA helicase, partial [Candidatus Bipolaricaulia bacterium]